MIATFSPFTNATIILSPVLFSHSTCDKHVLSLYPTVNPNIELTFSHNCPDGQTTEWLIPQNARGNLVAHPVGGEMPPIASRIFGVLVILLQEQGEFVSPVRSPMIRCCSPIFCSGIMHSTTNISPSVTQKRKPLRPNWRCAASRSRRRDRSPIQFSIRGSSIAGNTSLIWKTLATRTGLATRPEPKKRSREPSGNSPSIRSGRSPFSPADDLVWSHKRCHESSLFVTIAILRTTYGKKTGLLDRNIGKPAQVIWLFSLLILFQAQDEHYSQSSLDSQRAQALHDAELVAAFAGAHERFP